MLRAHALVHIAAAVQDATGADRISDEAADWLRRWVDARAMRFLREPHWVTDVAALIRKLPLNFQVEALQVEHLRQLETDVASESRRRTGLRTGACNPDEPGG